MVTWPTSLPAPQLPGYEITPDEAVLRTQIPGPARMRQRFSSVPETGKAAWSRTTPELALFEAWHKHTLGDGAIWFSIDLANGQGIQAMTARFSSAVQKSALPGLNWTLSVDLEVRDVPVAAV